MENILSKKQKKRIEENLSEYRKENQEQHSKQQERFLLWYRRSCRSDSIQLVKTEGTANSDPTG
ncbi:hypothetical protein FI080_23785 [Salmonella enterica subsp. enterica]|nr:hypothetical protein [Salmonella enterica subsp. enterica serovar Adelaide]